MASHLLDLAAARRRGYSSRPHHVVPPLKVCSVMPVIADAPVVITGADPDSQDTDPGQPVTV